jgi:hypothetical protein
VVGQNNLTFLYQLRLKTALPVLGSIDIESAIAAFDDLFPIGIALFALILWDSSEWTFISA